MQITILLIVLFCRALHRLGIPGTGVGLNPRIFPARYLFDIAKPIAPCNAMFEEEEEKRERAKGRKRREKAAEVFLLHNLLTKRSINRSKLVYTYVPRAYLTNNLCFIVA